MPKLTIFYHFYYPDSVVSAQLFTELAEHLASRNWDVRVVTSNRNRTDERISYPSHEVRNGVRIRRVWRPGFSQGRAFGRILNGIWLNTLWGLIALWKHRDADIVLLGTDPPFLFLMALCARLPAKHVLWSFDMYPEIATAEGVLPEGVLRRFLVSLSRKGLQGIDAVVPIGSCMERRYREAGIEVTEQSITPWSLQEQPHELCNTQKSIAREELFGGAILGILYSGSFGKAHQSSRTKELVAALRGRGIAITFCVPEYQQGAVRELFSPEDTHVRIKGLVPGSELGAHLASADIHLVSLQDSWSGLVVPSKFFGVLSAGRPVLFSGPESSSIHHWISTAGIGWSAHEEGGLSSLPERLLEYARDKDRQEVMEKRVLTVYQEHFSRAHGLASWEKVLTRLRTSPKH